MKVTLGPTHLPHAAGSDSRWPGGLRHARGPVHFICFGMFCRGLCTGQQTRKTLRNLNNLKVLQGNKYQLGLYGFGTHNAHKRTDWSFQAFLEVVCSTMTDTGVNVYRWPCPQQRDFKLRQKDVKQRSARFALQISDQREQHAFVLNITTSCRYMCTITSS